jgi:hypothetical protein
VILRDLSYALIGLAVSFILAAAAVPNIRHAFMGWLADLF